MGDCSTYLGVDLAHCGQEEEEWWPGHPGTAAGSLELMITVRVSAGSSLTTQDIHQGVKARHPQRKASFFWTMSKRGSPTSFEVLVFFPYFGPLLDI